MEYIRIEFLNIPGIAAIDAITDVQQVSKGITLGEHIPVDNSNAKHRAGDEKR